MNMLTITTLVVLLTYLSLSGTHAETCDKENRDSCYDTYFHQLEYEKGDDMAFPVFTVDEFNEVCGRKNDFEECVGAFEDNCTTNQKLSFQAARNGHQYACVEHDAEDYAKVMPCLNNTDLQKRASQCEDNGRDEMARIDDLMKNGEGEVNDLKNEFCRVMRGLQIDCVYKILKDECDEETALYMYSFLRVVRSTAVNRRGCEALAEDPSTLGKCTQENIQTCVDTNYEELMYEKGDGIAFPVRTVDKFNEICSRNDDFEKCLDVFEDNCTALEKETFQGARNGHQYSCVERGAEEYAKVIPCFNNMKLQKEASQCEDKGRDERARIEAQLFGNPPADEDEVTDLKNQYCKVMRDLQIDCVYKVLKDECDEETALYMYGYTRVVWAPGMNLQGCEALDEDPPSGAGSLDYTLLLHLAAILLVLFQYEA